MQRVIIISLFFLASCQSNKIEDAKVIETVDGVQTINIPLGNYSKTVSVSELFSHLEAISLEMTSSSVLASIDKIYISKDFIYILDVVIDRILIFHRNGEFYRSIGTKGRGPSEYNTISDFHVDFPTNRVILYDRSLFKFITFDLEGNFIDEVQKNIAGDSFTTIETGNLIFFKNNWVAIDSDGIGNNIAELDKDFNIINEFYPMNPKFKHWRHRSWQHFSKNQSTGELLFNSYFDFNIYRYNNSSFEVAYTVNAGQNQTDLEEVFQDTPLPQEFNVRLQRLNTIRGIESFYENDKFIHFHFWDTEVRNALIDKINNKIVVYSGFKNDIADHNIYRKVFGIDSDKMYLIGPAITENEFLDLYGSCCIMNNRDIEGNGEKGNPVLFIGTLNPSESVFE